jgi:hypothetical protein
LIAEMLSLSGGERFPPLDLSPQRKKERTLAALLRCPLIDTLSAPSSLRLVSRRSAIADRAALRGPVRRVDDGEG